MPNRFTRGKGLFGTVVADRIEVANASGAAATAGVSAAEGSGVHQTVLTLSDVAFALIDEAGVAAHKGLKVYDFPAGVIDYIGAVLDLTVTKNAAGVIDAFDGDVALGSAAAGAGATLIGTEADLVPTTATPQAVAGATTAKAKSTATEKHVVDGTTTPLAAYLNFVVDDTDQDVTTTPTSLIVNGTITITWANFGDY